MYTRYMNRPELVTVGEYHEQLVMALDLAQDRILLETMSFDGNNGMKEVISAVLLEANRGVDITLIYDRYSYLDALTIGGFAAVKRLKRTIKSLDKAGVKLLMVGALRLNPFSGRHHAKVVIADNLIFMAGGINLMGNSFDTNDYMWRFEDSGLADDLFELLPKVALSRTTTTLPISGDTTLLVDGGQKKQSVIYDKLCDMAERAEKLYYVSKLMPDGRLYDILSAKEVEYWYNTIKSAPPFDMPALIIDKLKYTLPNNYTKPNMLHAKFCVAVMPDGSMEAISGSHNFNYRGVAFGTQELAMHTTNQALCRQLLDFAQTL